MDETQWGLINMLGPIILGLVLVWVVLKSRSKSRRSNDRSEQATHNLYEEEEQRRREGSDGL